MKNKKHGLLITLIDGELHSYEQDFPMEDYIGCIAWGEDMMKAIHAHGKFRKWLIRLALGKYAYREMIGLDETINLYGFNTHDAYELKEMDYHKDKVNL